MDIKTAEKFKQEAVNSLLNRTTPGIGPGGWNSGKLAASQERAVGSTINSAAVVYRLYTEARMNLSDIVSRYFHGATLFYANGLWNGALESSVVIEIVGSASDLQSITHLAGDIRHANNQTAVLVTWAPVSLLLVTA